MTGSHGPDFVYKSPFSCRFSPVSATAIPLAQMWVNDSCTLIKTITLNHVQLVHEANRLELTCLQLMCYHRVFLYPAPYLPPDGTWHLG